MLYRLLAAPTFVLDRSIEFLTRFPPCRGDFVLAPGRATGVFAVRGCAVAYTVTAGRDGALAVETAEPAVVPMVAAMLGVDDDLTGFYAKAAGDAAVFRRIVARLRGLHHVRFRTLEEVAVHAVLAQRTPIALAATQKRAVAAALGPSVEVAGTRLVAFPTFDRLAKVTEAEWLTIVGNRAKAARLPGVVRGVAELGAEWLASARYTEALAALQAIGGIGPFSAAMILLRGLGRMDDVPLDAPGIGKVAAAVYGAGWDGAAIRERYGTYLGYWSYYLKAGVTLPRNTRSVTRLTGDESLSRGRRRASPGSRIA
jgi:DNA-3-methyladenine glycosylase II